MLLGKRLSHRIGAVKIIATGDDSTPQRDLDRHQDEPEQGALCVRR